ncbi:anti-phage deoxyguanosine triphosphatase [Paraferrimonas sp. SM1919]|uniref:anti-phage deoxyguanosine triphosphatase n=1 Tax=Paraferrimonas sp. SM1919 TaxID=2662263 RepID=UPI0013D4183F|nr:anti-phage deoxyguanosine triphosphatase [Paraferrimonas sp. SM1919]
MTLDPLWQQRASDRQCPRPNDHRNPFQRDKARILHSAAFRRLQAKTQVIGTGIDDFYRTRLTHSIEAAQIGTGIVHQLINSASAKAAVLPSIELIEAICLAHDIGHPPFGHGGEQALDQMMLQHGGFEGNGQTFRILTKLEPYTQHNGMDLSRRTLLGLIKYPNRQSILKQDTSLPNSVAVKAIYDDDLELFNWVLAPLSEADKSLFMTYQQSPTRSYPHLKTRFCSLDCSIMELSDDIAYGVHDLEDAIVTQMVTSEDFHEEVITPIIELGNKQLNTMVQSLTQTLFSHKPYIRKDAIGMLVNSFITNISLKQRQQEFESPLLKYFACLDNEHQCLLNLLKKFIFKRVIQSSSVQQMEFKGQRIIRKLFEAFATDPERLLPTELAEHWQMHQQNNNNPHRIICDYIASMTDISAQKMYKKLYG